MCCRCDLNAEDLGVRLFTCVNETLAEGRALGLPEEILLLIDSCNVRPFALLNRSLCGPPDRERETYTFRERVTHVVI